MRRSIDEDGRNVKRLQLDREVMIQVDNSAAEAEVTGRQPDVKTNRQVVEAVGRDVYRGPELEQEQHHQQQHTRQQPTTLHPPIS